jgi:putative transposase
VDTEGNVWAVHVHAANCADTVEGCVLADLALADLPSVRAVCADQGYRGTFFNHVRYDWNIDVHISGREGKGFEVEPKRWVVERTFSWFNGQRRLSKDYEKGTNSSVAMTYIAAIARLLRGLVFN